MLKKSNVEIVYQIERYTPDIKTKTVNVEIATGTILDGIFVSDNRGLTFLSISNIPDKTIQKSESLIVDVNGQVTLSETPIDNNDIEVGGVAQEPITGQLVTCSGYVENDIVAVSYYHIVAGRNWFNEAANFVKEDNPEYAGLDDYQYNAKRLWSILIEMGLISGAIV
jgi:hypothetical protein